MYRQRMRTRAVSRKKAAQAQPARYRGRTREDTLPVSLNMIRTVICGGLFVTLVALKLLLPGSLSGPREKLGSWLARDADLAEAFSAVGRAASGEQGVKESLEEAYIAVFGANEAREASLAAEIPQEPESTAVGEEPDKAAPRAYPEHALAEQRVLGFEFSAPLYGELTSPFGWREHPVSGSETFHYGVDIAAAEGTDIGCFADGRVGIVGDSVELGRYLTVHHGNGIITLYAHCGSICVSSGDEVKRGDKLGEVGSTGNATGPHLHFEIHDGEDYLDPKYYLS